MIEAHAWIAAYPIAFLLLMMFGRLLMRKFRQAHTDTGT
jgi:hypothetical protein